ncbi:hypothetical protein H7A76_30325 [Pseudomonas sp. MSSRFD41]|uniref:hypothetical protein n=1 Tax=Pseudomonas sp. MSSRFD41 TaxID=1310370 RepID=UPI00163B12A1|nr:hypothetical protein [Pseudomonas sp. MSSRFD41]MBC2659751.1 hypothetical protein [Pseudomonas sp. MSSRFD41]
MANNPFYVDPGNDYSSGLSGLSATLANVRQGRMQMRAEEEQKQRQAEASAAAQQAYESGDPDMMAKVSLQYPEIAQNLHQVVGLNDERKVKEAAGFARDLLLASPDQREAIFQKRIQSLQDQGRDPTHTAQAYQQYLQDPNGTLQGIELDWAAGAPKEYSVIAEREKAKAKLDLERAKMDREDARFDRAEAGRNQRAYARAAATAGGSASDKRTAHQKDFEQYQELAKTDPEAAKAFGQASGFVSKEGRELAPGVQTRLAKTIDSAVDAENKIGKYNSLANDIEKSNLRGGVFGGSWAEKVKEITGSQDSVTELRKEFAQARAAQASANLPPGSASDADVALALGPIPSDNANKQQLASYLRGQAKLAQINADFHNFKADYISNTGSERGMLQAWKEQGKAGAQRKPSPQPAAAPPPAAGGWRIVE